MMLVMLGFGLVSLRWQEKLPVGDGFGWDGVNYGTWAKDFYKSVVVDKLTGYYVQRMAPSAIVHYGTRAVLFPFYSQEQVRQILAQNETIIIAFGIYNLLLLLFSVYLWARIADKLGITERGKWFGFCALFLNYAIAKSNFYQPVLTDTSAFFLGLLMFYFFLKRNSIGLLGVMIAGGFIWPTLPITAAILIVFPRTEESDEPPVPAPVAVRTLSVGISAAACLAVLALFIYFVRQGIAQDWDKAESLRVDFGLVYLSMAAAIIYLFWGFKAALMDSRLFNIRYLLKTFQWKWAVAAVLVLVLLRITVHHLALPVPSTWTFKLLFIYIFISALTEPFIFVVSHAIYYGPIILLIVVFWRLFCDQAGRFGVGFRLFVLLNLFLSICPQSRYQIPAISAFVIVMVCIVDRLGLQRWDMVAWIALSLFYSKIWFIFNTAPMAPSGMASLLSFPLQNFFMNSGPWMSHSMYIVQGSIILVTLVLLTALVMKLRLREAAAIPRAID